MAERSGIPTDHHDDAEPDAATTDRVRADAADDAADAARGDAARDDAARPDEGRGAADHDRPVVTRSAHSLVWQVRIASALAILGVALAVFMYLDTADERTAAQVRDEVREAGELVALRVTTFEGATIDAWVEDTRELATGDYAEEVSRLFDTEIRTGLAELQVQSVGEITSSFVQEVDGDSATVFLVLRQTFTTVEQPQPVSDELRMEIELDREDGEWLASEVAVLGPSTVTPVTGDEGTEQSTPPAEEPPAEEGS